MGKRLIVIVMHKPGEDKDDKGDLRRSRLSFSFLWTPAPTPLSLSPTDRVERADLLLHQHRGSVHSLPRRGLPEAGLPGDQGMHPGSPPLAERKPAAGESQGRFMVI